MATTEKPYSFGEWLVKDGKEEEFISHWQVFARQTAKDFKAASGAYLLQDKADPRHFVSFGEWAKPDAIEKWRTSPEFRNFLSNIQPLCDDVEPCLMKLVAIAEPGPVGGKKDLGEKLRA